MTRDSIKAKPKRNRALMEPAEPGFLDIPSKADLIALLWAIAPAIADRVRPPTLTITAQTSLSEPDPPSPAKRGERNKQIIKNLLRNFSPFIMQSLLLKLFIGSQI